MDGTTPPERPLELTAAMAALTVLATGTAAAAVVLAETELMDRAELPVAMAVLARYP
jgi:hypothetical protein